MPALSLTGVGAVITVIEAILKWFNIEVAEGTVAAGVNGAVSFAGLVLIVWGQLRRKDVHLGIFKK